MMARRAYPDDVFAMAPAAMLLLFLLAAPSAAAAGGTSPSFPGAFRPLVRTALLLS